MATKVIGAEIRVDGKQASQSVGNFKKELREANNELLQVIDKFGRTSTEAANAAKRVESLRGAIDDANKLVSAFDGDRKFEAFSSAIGGVAAGFSALQGAQALFGEKSAELEETLLKVQAAMALSQGINGLLDAKNAFINLAAVVKTQVVTAFGTLRSALISTGIGALVVGVGLLIQNFEKVKAAIVNLIPGAKQFFELIGDIVDTVKGWFGANEDVIDSQKALEEATRELEGALKSYEGQIDNVVAKEKLRARIAGQSQDEINKIDQAGLLAKIRTYEKLIKEAQDYGIATVALEQKRAELVNQLELKQLEGRAQAAEAARAKQKKQEDDFFKQDLEEIRKRNLLLPKQLEDAGRTALENTRSVLKAQVEETKAAIEQDASNREAVNMRITQSRLDALDQIRAADEAELESKRQTTEAIGDITGKLSDAIGKQTAVGKALGIATALINTYQGASEVIRAKSTLPEPVATISKIANVAAIIATGIKSVKAITAVKVPGSGGGGQSIPSVQPLQPQAATTTLDQGSINAIGSAASRSFVLEQDVTNNQERVRRLNRAARIN